MTYEHARADFTYNSVMLFCELSLKIAGYQSAWVLYGSPPQIHDVGGILEALLKDDFSRLDALGTDWSRLLPWFHRRARSVVTPFMESEAHQEIINADYQGFPLNLIAEKVHRSLPEEYIERSLVRLQQTIQTATHWSSLKWTIGIILSSILFIISTIAFIQRAESHTMLATQDHLILFPVTSGLETLGAVAFFTIPLSFSGWLFAKWMSKRWIKCSGGKQLVDWASNRGLLFGKLTATSIIVLSTVVATSFFSSWPMWMDREGKLYGTLAIFQVPRIIEPMTVPPKSPAKRHILRKAK